MNRKDITMDLANAIGRIGEHPDESLMVLWDGDGSCVYQWVSAEALREERVAAMAWDLLLERRATVRAEMDLA